jgi:hypothetical protein
MYIRRNAPRSILAILQTSQKNWINLEKFEEVWRSLEKFGEFGEKWLGSPPAAGAAGPMALALLAGGPRPGSGNTTTAKPTPWEREYNHC